MLDRHSLMWLATVIRWPASGLPEHFQWLTPDQSRAVCDDAAAMAAIQDELADVAIYFVRPVDVLNVDLMAAVDAKVARNEHRLPSEP